MNEQRPSKECNCCKDGFFPFCPCGCHQRAAAQRVAHAVSMEEQVEHLRRENGRWENAHKILLAENERLRQTIRGKTFVTAEPGGDLVQQMRLVGYHDWASAVERLQRPAYEREPPHCPNCSCPPYEPWQPIETAPTEGKAIYWIVPLPAEETYRDSSGNPVVAKFEPYAAILLHRGWSSLSKATHWMPIPRTPSQPPGAVPE